MKTQLLSLVDTFQNKESELTDLDRSIGDGDHGVNMERGFSHLKDNIDDKDMASLFKSTGMTLMSNIGGASGPLYGCLLYTSPSPRDKRQSRMPSSA